MLVSSSGVRRLRSQSGILGSLPDAVPSEAVLDGVAAWRNGPLADDLSLVIVELR